MSSPTQRSLKYLRSCGCEAAVVEHWNPFAHIRQDLFGWIDIVAVDTVQIIGVQTTTKSNMKARLMKARGNMALANWLQAGGVLIIHGWYKVKNRWKLDTRTLSAGDVL